MEEAGVLVVAVVTAAARVGGVTHRDVLLQVETTQVREAEVPQAHAAEAIRAHGLLHLAQHAAPEAPTAEAAHQEPRALVRVRWHVRSKPLPTAPGLHRLHQRETRQRLAANSEQRLHKIGNRCGNSKQKTAA